MPEVAAPVLGKAAEQGPIVFIAALFGLFVLVYVWLDHRRTAARDEEHRVAVAQAYELLRDQAAKRVEETRELMRCTRDGINGCVVEMRRVNLEFTGAIVDPLKKIEAVIDRNTKALGRAERVLDGITIPNGHG